MNSSLAFKRALEAVERELVNVQLDLATRNVESALLELHYIPDQLRVPAGSPDGGQWTDEGRQNDLFPATSVIQDENSGADARFRELTVRLP